MLAQPFTLAAPFIFVLVKSPRNVYYQEYAMLCDRKFKVFF